MKVINKRDEKINTSTCVALGFFDGVHIGHRAVIDVAVNSKKDGLSACIFSFTIHSETPDKKNGAKEIQTPVMKLKTFDKIGADYVYMPDFSDFKNLSPEEFIDEVLIKLLNAKKLCCGSDFRFGHFAKGDAEFLKEYCAKKGIETIIVTKLLDNGEDISSTRIRNYLADGDIKSANRLLGRPFSFSYEVIHGHKLGRTINIPTINQQFDDLCVIPKFGVYASYVVLNGKKYPSVTNIGVKPTVETHKIKPLAETYIIGIDEDLYGEEIEVALLDFLREEKKFSGIGELKSAINENAKQAKDIFNKFINQ